MTCEPEKQKDDPKKSMEIGVVAMASGEIENRATSFTPDEGCVSENKQLVVQEGVGVQDTNWQRRCEELEKELQDVNKEYNSHLQGINKQLVEQNTELLGKLPVNDLVVSGLEHEIDQLGTEENYKTKYYVTKKKLEELTLKCRKIVKNNIELQVKIGKRGKKDELKETMHNEDGARRSGEVASISSDTILKPQQNNERQRWLRQTFSSVYQPNSKPDFGPRTSSYCPCSCGRNSSYFLFELKGLYFCPEKLNKTMDRMLIEVVKDKPNLRNINLENCSEFVTKLWLAGLVNIVLEENSGLTYKELHNTLQNGMNILICDHNENVGLLFVGYSNSDDYHCVVMMEFSDPTDKRIKMQIYDPQADDWWLNADQNVEFVDKILLYKIETEVAGQWIPSCGQQSCLREHSQR